MMLVWGCPYVVPRHVQRRVPNSPKLQYRDPDVSLLVRPGQSTDSGLRCVERAFQAQGVQPTEAAEAATRPARKDQDG